MPNMSLEELKRELAKKGYRYHEQVEPMMQTRDMARSPQSFSVVVYAIKTVSEDNVVRLGSKRNLLSVGLEFLDQNEGWKLL